MLIASASHRTVSPPRGILRCWRFAPPNSIPPGRTVRQTVWRALTC